ncbi:putative DNA-binding protein [Yersinia intermedia]|nr:putative DNA-binding protein [Yersinia intermedia]
MDEGSASGRMNHYEKGRHVPDIETLRKIGTILNVPLSYFFCEDELSAELVTLFQKLGKEDKLTILNRLRKDADK